MLKKNKKVTSKGRSRKKLLLFESGEKTFEAEKIRSIQVSLQLSLLARKKNKRIMFTSANKGEGKTFCISNIAKEFARQGKKVLLLDMDLHRPRLTKQLLYKGQNGLMTVMQNPELLEESQFEIENNFYFMPTGPLPPNPLEIISSTAFEELLDTLDSMYDILLIDTPPIRVLADGRVIASLCDGVVLVVREGITKVAEVEEIQGYINKSGAALIGAILNAHHYKKKDKSNYAYY
ncbi:capsular polysaccharide biosynthesis protein [Listeria fleischmannii 1991]|uniref:non-specific protein-tyrosine kinase n=2 Tax=Listeria fleischmannii TaxID=1069827 RepID=A0A2X3GPU8_9LIST|nr:CpsD/CapB family tyrosine-protein kinase [Listeria fleischmannii]KMT61440.1 capsular polysaccharide biosynthesis protein [Listeria fleischmannii 1991]SQC70398.1 Tyrosine-protein kinase YwqD [Listeria fleischmannii subsp. fleischmannii]